MYSPPRITHEIRRGKWKHLAPGFALDLVVVDPKDGQPWDFNVTAKRERARKLFREQKPYLLVASPERKACSTWHSTAPAAVAQMPSAEHAWPHGST